MISLPHNNMEMRLSRAPCVLDPLLYDILRLFHKLPVQIYRISGYIGVVLTEDELGCLLVECVHLGGVRFAFVGERLGGCAVAGGVGVLGARKAGGALGGFGAGEVAEAVVFDFGVVFTGAVEGCKVSERDSGLGATWDVHWGDSGGKGAPGALGRTSCSEGAAVADWTHSVGHFEGIK